MASASPQHHQSHNRNQPGEREHHVSSEGQTHHLSSPHSNPQQHQSHDRNHPGTRQHHVASKGQNHHLSAPHGSPQEHQSHDTNHPENYHHESSEGGRNHYLSSPQSRHPVPAHRNNAKSSPHLIVIRNNGTGHNLHPIQHAELRFPRAPRVHQMDEFPSQSSDHTSDQTDPNYPRYVISDGATVEISQQQRWPDEDDENLTSTENQTTRFGCYSIPEPHAVLSAAKRASSAAVEAAGPVLASSMAAARRLHEGVYLQHQKTFASCLYPKSVKLQLHVGAVEKPAEHIHDVEATEFVRHDRNVRVSLMSSTDSPEAISLKLFHGLDDLETEPEPENMEMPAELMPAPGAEPADAVVKLNFMAFGDTHKGRMHKHCGTGLDISGLGMRKLGIGAHVCLRMAHQFAEYSLRLLNQGLHLYGPIVTKAAVSSYKGLRRGSQVLLHKSAPVASHVKGVAVTHMRRTTERCFKITRKRKAAWIACISAGDDSDDELDSQYGEMEQLDSNHSSYYDSNLAWEQGLRVYPESNYKPEPLPNSGVRNCNCIDDSDEDDDDDDEPMDFMGENPLKLGPGDEPSPEMFSGFEPGRDPSHNETDNPGDGPYEGPEQDNRRLTAGNSDNAGRIVPFESDFASKQSRNPVATCRRRLSLSPVPNKPRVHHHRATRGPIRGHGLGALVWPPEDVRTYGNPLKEDLVAEKIAVRADYQQNYRDLMQKPINVDEGIWRSTLRAYLKEETAVVRPEDVLLQRRNVPMKLVSREEFEKYEEENRHTAHHHLKHTRLQIAHGDTIVHHCVTKKKPDKKLHPSQKPLSNRGKDRKKQSGHNSSFPHLKHHDEFGSVAKHDDHEKLNMKNKGSHAISSVPSEMEDGEFWQTNPVHSSESDWKVLSVSPPPQNGKKRPHSPEDEIMEQVPHSREFQAVEHSDTSSQSQHPSHHPPGKHQKLEVLSAPDSLMTTKFANRPLRIRKHKLSSDRTLVGSPAEFGQIGRPLKLGTIYSPESPQLWQYTNEAPIAESLTVGSKGEHFHALQTYPRNGSFERHIGCDIGLIRSFPSSLQSYHEHLHSLPRCTPKGSNEHHKLRTPAFRKEPQERPRVKPEFQLLTRHYCRTHPYPSQKCHERLSRIPKHLNSVRQPSDSELRRKCPSLNSEKSPSPWDRSLGSSRSVRSSFTPDRESKPIVAKPRVSVFKAALSFLRPYSFTWQILRRQPVKHEQGHQTSKRFFWYTQMLRTKFGNLNHTSQLPSFLKLSPKAKLRISMFKKIRPASGSHSPGKSPGKIITAVHQYSDLSQITGGTASDRGQALVHSQNKISPKRHENVPRVKIFLSRKDPCGVRSLLHGTAGGKVHIKSGGYKQKAPKNSFSSATGSKRAKPEKVKTDSRFKIRTSRETHAALKTDSPLRHAERASAKRNHAHGKFFWELSSSPRNANSFQKHKASSGQAPTSPSSHGGVVKSAMRSPRNQGHLQTPIRSSSILTRQMQKYEYPTKAHLLRSNIHSAPHHGDNLWSSKFLTPDIRHLMQSLQRAGNIPSHTDQKKLEGQFVYKMHPEQTSRAQTDHELQSIHNSRDSKSSHSREDHGLKRTSKKEFKRHVTFVNDLEENPTSTGVTMSDHVRTEMQSLLVENLIDNPQESDGLGSDSDRGVDNDTSTQNFGNFDAGSGNNLPTPEASHHEPNASIDSGTTRFLNYTLPGDDEESSSDTSDEVDSPQISYQRNPDISNLLTAYKEALRKEVQSPYAGTLETDSVLDSGTIFRPETDPAEHSYHNSSNFHDQTLRQPTELHLHINKHTQVSPPTEPLSLESIDAMHSTSGTSRALHIPTLANLEGCVGSPELNNQETAYIGHRGEGESNNNPESHHFKPELEFHNHRGENETHFPSPAKTHSSQDDESSAAMKNEAWSPEHQGEHSSAFFQDVAEPNTIDTDRVLELVRGQLSAQSPESSTTGSTEVKIPIVRDGEQEGDAQRSVIAEDLDVEGGMINQNFPQFKFSDKLAAWETILRNDEPQEKEQPASDDMNIGGLASKHDQNPSESAQVRGLDSAKSSKQQSDPKTIHVISVSRAASRERLGKSNDDQDKNQDYTYQGLPTEGLHFSLRPPAGQQSDLSTVDIISASRSPSGEHFGRSNDDQDKDREYTTQGLPTEDLESHLGSPAAQKPTPSAINIISLSRSQSRERLGGSNDDQEKDQGLPNEDLESHLGSPAAQQSDPRTINISSLSRSQSRERLGRSNDDQVKDQEHTPQGLPTEDLESRLGSLAAQLSDPRTINIISLSRSQSRERLERSNDDQEKDQGLPNEDLESHLGSPAAQQSDPRMINIISLSRSQSRERLGKSNDDQHKDQGYTSPGLPTEDLESRLGSLGAHQSDPRTINIISLSRSQSRERLGRGNDDQDKDQEYTIHGLPTEDLESHLGSPAPQQSDPRTINISYLSRSQSRERLGRSNDDQEKDQEYTTQGLPTEDLESPLESPAAQQLDPRTINIISLSRSQSRKLLGRNDDDQDGDHESTQGLASEDLKESRLESPARLQSGSKPIDIISVSRSSSSKHLGRSNDDHVESEEYTTEGLATEDLEESRLGFPAPQQSGSSAIDVLPVSRSLSSKHLGRGYDYLVEHQEYTQGLGTEDVEESRLRSPTAPQPGPSTININPVSRSPSREGLGKSNDDQDGDREHTQRLATGNLEKSRLGSPAVQVSGSRTIDLISLPRTLSSELLGRSNDDQDEGQVYSIEELPIETSIADESFASKVQSSQGDVKIEEVNFDNANKLEIERLQTDTDDEKPHQDDSAANSKTSWLSMDDNQLESRLSLATPVYSHQIIDTLTSHDDEGRLPKKRHSKDDSQLGLSSSQSVHSDEVAPEEKLIYQSRKTPAYPEKFDKRNALKLILDIDKELSDVSSPPITEEAFEDIISGAEDDSDEHAELEISTLSLPADTQDSSTNVEELLNTLKSGENVNVQTSDNKERPLQPGPSPLQGSLDGSDVTSPPFRSKTRGSLFVRPLLKKSLVTTSETEATFAQLRSENNRAGIQDDSRIEKRSSMIIRGEGEIRRSSSFEGLQSSDGARSRNRGSLFVRPVLKKSLVASSETEQTFSRLRSEQREQDDGDNTGYRSNSFLDGGGLEARSRLSDSPRNRDSLSPSDGTSVPARSQTRGSLFVRPMLKKSLVVDSETQKSFARLQSDQSEVQDTKGRGSISRSASFEGLRGSRSGSVSVSPISVPGRSTRGSLFVRPVLKKSLVADSETRASFDKLKSEQNEDVKNNNREESLEGKIGESQVSERIRGPSRSSRGSTFIRPVLKNSLVADSETEATFARLQLELEGTSSEQGFDTRESTGIGRSNSFESLVGSRPSPPTDPKGSDGNTVPIRPRKSLFTRPDLKRSLVANPETEKMFSEAQSDQSEIEERLESRRTSNEGLKWVASRASQIRSPEELFSPNLASRVSLIDDRFSPESSSRKSLLPRPSLKRSIMGQNEPENQRPPSKSVTFDATPEDSSYESYESEAEG